MGAPTKRIDLPEEDLMALQSWVASGEAEDRIVSRAKVILAAVEGLALREIADKTGLSYNSCLKW